MSLYCNGSVYFQNVSFSITDADVEKPGGTQNFKCDKETIVIENSLECCSQHSGTLPISWQFLLYNRCSMGKLLTDCKV